VLQAPPADIEYSRNDGILVRTMLNVKVSHTKSKDDWSRNLRGFGAVFRSGKYVR